MMYNKNSIWDDLIDKFPKYNILNKDITTDVCIIGGGITGISTGYYLNKNNIDFVLLESNKICNNTTKFSTAKITSQHNLIYSDIAKKYGLSCAKLYLEANNKALNNIKDIIEFSSHNVGVKDYKTVLQEVLQTKGDVNIKYTIIKEEGPDHDKNFTAEVECDGKKLACGQGRSKKLAEMEAARKALKLLK